MAELLYLGEKEKYSIAEKVEELLKEEFRGYFENGYEIFVESVIATRSNEKMRYTIWGVFGAKVFELECTDEYECERMHEILEEEIVIPISMEGYVEYGELKVEYSLSPSAVREYSLVGLDFNITIHWRELSIEELASVISKIIAFAVYITNIS